MRIFGGFIQAYKALDNYRYQTHTVPVCIIKEDMGQALESAREAVHNTFPLSEGYYSHGYDLVENERFEAVEVTE